MAAESSPSEDRVFPAEAIGPGLAGKCVKGLPRRSSCRSSWSAAIDSGSDVSRLFLRCNSRKRAKRPTESGKRSQPIVGCAQLDQARHTRNGFGQCLEGVFTDIQIAQLALIWREHGGSERQLIVVKIEKIGQTIQIGQRVRYVGKLLCPRSSMRRVFKRPIWSKIFPTDRCRPRPEFRARFVPTPNREHGRAVASISSNGGQMDARVEPSSNHGKGSRLGHMERAFCSEAARTSSHLRGRRTWATRTANKLSP